MTYLHQPVNDPDDKSGATEFRVDNPWLRTVVEDVPQNDDIWQWLDSVSAWTNSGSTPGLDVTLRSAQTLRLIPGAGFNVIALYEAGGGIFNASDSTFDVYAQEPALGLTQAAVDTNLTLVTLGKTAALNLVQASGVLNIKLGLTTRLSLATTGVTVPNDLTVGALSGVVKATAGLLSAGTLTAGDLAALLASNNVWTGTNEFQNSVTLSGANELRFREAGINFQSPAIETLELESGSSVVARFGNNLVSFPVGATFLGDVTAAALVDLDFQNSAGVAFLRWTLTGDYQIHLPTVVALEIDATSMTLGPGGTDVGFGYDEAAKLKLRIGSVAEATLESGKITFEAGATDVGLSWISGVLNVLVGAAVEASFAANALTFNNGLSDTGFEWATSGSLGFVVGATIEASLTADTFTFEAGATDVGLEWATSAQLGFKIGSTKEMWLAADSLNFEAGATDVGLDWATTGSLGFKVGSTIEMALTADNLTFEAGATDVAISWATSAVMDFKVGATIEASIDANGIMMPTGKKLQLGGTTSYITDTAGIVAGVVGSAAVNLIGSTTTLAVTASGAGLTLGGAVPYIGGTIKANTTAVGNVGVGEDNLITFSVVANVLSVNGMWLRWRAAGTFATSANNKRLRAYFGATALIDTTSLAITTTTDWIAEGIIIRTGAATQKAITSVRSGSALLVSITDYTTPAETLSGAVTLKCTGEATANNDVVQQLLVVEWGSAA